MEILYILLLFVLAAGFLVLLWFLLGKTGLFIFAPFGTILANYQASGGVVDLWGLSFVPSAGMYVLLLSALLFLVYKFGARYGYFFIAVVLLTAVIDVVSDQVAAAMWEDSSDILNVIRVCGANIIATLATGTVGIMLFEMFRKKELSFLLNAAISLTIMVAVDATIFPTIAFAGSAPFGDHMLTILNNWWHKLAFIALTLPIIWGMAKMARAGIADQDEAPKVQRPSGRLNV